jgi:hypothetical protein
MNNQYLLQFNCITEGRHVNDIQRTAFRHEPRKTREQADGVNVDHGREELSRQDFMCGMKNAAPVG